MSVFMHVDENSLRETMIARVGCAQIYKQGDHGQLRSKLSLSAAVLVNFKYEW